MIDLKNAIVLAIDFQERVITAMHESEDVIRKTVIFFKGCRILDVPILVMQQYTKGLGGTIAPIKEALGEFEYIEKEIFSSYKNEEFKAKLEQSGKTEIIVTGAEAHVCVQQTVLDLLDHGYKVYVLVDCISSRFAMDRKFSMKRMETAGAIFTTMESMLFEMLGSANHPRRKEITQLVK